MLKYFVSKAEKSENIFVKFASAFIVLLILFIKKILFYREGVIFYAVIALLTITIFSYALPVQGLLFDICKTLLLFLLLIVVINFFR